MSNNRAIELIRKYLPGKAKPEDKKIDDWYNCIDDAGNFKTGNDRRLQVFKAEIYQQIRTDFYQPKKKPVIRFYNRLAFWAATAIFTAVVSLTALIFLANSSDGKSLTATIKPPVISNEIRPPLANRAILTLAGGKAIRLDSVGSGNFATQGNMNIVKLANDRIAYRGYAADEIIFNTLAVPRGSTPVKVVLSDSTEIWVNVASSVTYPVDFGGNERTVEITGEAYFEVAANKAIPFKIKRANDSLLVELPGAHFNINAYDDDTAMKVTLLQGSAEVSKAGKHDLIKPGQQAIIVASNITIAGDADMEEALAWKNGRFYFDGADIKTIMRQLEKWYNVEVAYQSDIDNSFEVKISRNVNVSDLLTELEKTGQVHFKVEQTKITVAK